MTFSITTICHYAESGYAECCDLFIVMQNVVMLSVVVAPKLHLTRRNLGRVLSCMSSLYVSHLLVLLCNKTA